jgi:hypothetical protein
MVTVACNEALGHYLAHEEKGFATFGLNPGVISTDIRTPMLGFDVSFEIGWWFSFFTLLYVSRANEWVFCRTGLVYRLTEGFIGMVGRTLKEYIPIVSRIAAAPELGIQASGTVFNTFGEAAKPNPAVATEAKWREIIDYSANLVKNLDFDPK